MAPCIPAQWPSYKIHYRFRETVYHISVKRVDEASARVIRVTLDGAEVSGAGIDAAGRPRGMIPLVDDWREHYVEVELS